MTRNQALERWRKFADLQRAAPHCGHPDFEDDWQRFAALFADSTDRRELIRFGAEVEHLAWPERCGESPWEFARSVSDVLRRDAGQVTDALLERPYWRAVRAVLVRLEARPIWQGWWRRWRGNR